MTEQSEAIVIGAGLGGLSAAARLAKAGHKVLVLEQSSGPGGYAHGRYHDDYYFDFSLHSMDGVAPGGWAYLTLKQLGVLDRVRFERLDPYYLAYYPQHKIVAHANPFAYESELISHFPEDANGLRSLFDEMMAIYRDAHRGRVDHALERYPSPEEMLKLHPAIIRGVRESWADMMARHIHNPQLKAIVSAQWIYGGLAPSRMNAAAVALLWSSAHYFGGFYPHGGSMAINRALEDIIREGGGDILYGHRVTRVHVNDGLATGVTTDQGLEATAKVFVSNANAPDTLLKLIGTEQLPSGYTNRIKVTPLSLSSFNVYLGLDRDLTTEYDLPHDLLIADDYDPEKQYAAIQQGDWDKVPYMMVHTKRTNPESAPKGKAAVTIMCLAPWDYGNTWGTNGDLANYSENATYQDLKETVAASLIDRAEQHVPGLRDAIRVKEMATPLTNARYTLNRGGSIYGFEQSSEHMYLGRLNEETPVDNLFLAGAWTLPGGGQSAALLSGYDGGGHCLLYLENKPREVTFFASTDQPAATKPTVETPPSTTAFFPVGEPSPDFHLTAIRTGREVSLKACADRPLVLIFVSQTTTGAIGDVNEAVRAQFPLASQAVVASVIGLSNVPGLFHQLIKQVLGWSYKQAAAGVPGDLDPADFVLILPDWDGKMYEQFHVPDTSKAAAVVIIDRTGMVQGAFHGDTIAEQTVQTLRWL